MVQTKVNIKKRNININSHDSFCPFCHFEDETIFSLVWSHCYKWIGVQLALPMDSVIFYGATTNFMQRKLGQYLVVYLVCSNLSIWLHRNCILKNEDPNCE
ncbi:hypothetical protein CR513_06756, partial [Mucuna pruriens]